MMEENWMALFKRSNAKADDHDDPGAGDDMVSFDDDAYAWWADRDELERAFVPKTREVPHSGRPKATGSPSGDADDADFASRYSTESLFNWASSPEPDDPTHGGAGLPVDPYLVLGLQPGASLDQVVAAHRALAKRYHPDQFYSEGDDARHAAAQKMATVNAAYQELRRRLTAHRHTV